MEQAGRLLYDNLKIYADLQRLIDEGEKQGQTLIYLTNDSIHQAYL